MGRRRKSRRERLASGNAGKRRLPPEPAVTAPPAPPRAIDPPAWLDGAARARWIQVAPDLVLKGALTSTSAAVLADWCYWRGVFETAAADIATNGITLLTPTRHKRMNPAVQIAHRASSVCAELGARLGMDPRSARLVGSLGGQQLELPIPASAAEKQDDPHARFFGAQPSFASADDTDGDDESPPSLQ
jgi:P27 family predicted phage terminase small subunit